MEMRTSVGEEGEEGWSVRLDNSALRYLLSIGIFDRSVEGQAVKHPVFT
jgi:hypothetical protein